jgi:hypothetical protein
MHYEKRCIVLPGEVGVKGTLSSHLLVIWILTAGAHHQAKLSNTMRSWKKTEDFPPSPRDQLNAFQRLTSRSSNTWTSSDGAPVIMAMSKIDNWDRIWSCPIPCNSGRVCEPLVLCACQVCRLGSGASDVNMRWGVRTPENLHRNSVWPYQIYAPIVIWG